MLSDQQFLYCEGYNGGYDLKSVYPESTYCKADIAL